MCQPGRLLAKLVFASGAAAILYGAEVEPRFGCLCYCSTVVLLCCLCCEWMCCPTTKELCEGSSRSSSKKESRSRS